MSVDCLLGWLVNWPVVWLTLSLHAMMVKSVHDDADGANR